MTAPTEPAPAATVGGRFAYVGAVPAPEGLLARTGPGWLLVLDAVTSSDGSGGSSQALFVVAPDGTRYLLTDHVPAFPTTGYDSVWRIVDWRAGSDRARVALSRAPALDAGGSDAGWLDLRTGVVTPDEGDDAGVPMARTYLARTADGTDLWVVQSDGNSSDGLSHLYATTNGATRDVGALAGTGTLAWASPSLDRVASISDDARSVVVLDVATGRRTVRSIAPPDMECSLLGWADDESLLTRCFLHTGGGTVASWQPELWRVHVDSPTVEVGDVLRAGQPFAPTWTTGANAGDGVVVFPAFTLDDQVSVASMCADSVWQWSSSGGLRQVQGAGERGDDLFQVASVGGYGGEPAHVFVAATPGCSSGVVADEITGYGPDGDATPLFPAASPAELTARLTWAPAR